MIKNFNDNQEFNSHFLRNFAYISVNNISYKYLKLKHYIPLLQGIHYLFNLKPHAYVFHNGYQMQCQDFLKLICL